MRGMSGVSGKSGGVSTKFGASTTTNTRRHGTTCLGDAMLATILIIVLILMLFGSGPWWPHSAAWGYGPVGGFGLVLVILLILLLLGHL